MGLFVSFFFESVRVRGVEFEVRDGDDERERRESDAAVLIFSYFWVESKEKESSARAV